jgi:hypothetical protein
VYAGTEYGYSVSDLEPVSGLSFNVMCIAQYGSMSYETYIHTQL